MFRWLTVETLIANGENERDCAARHVEQQRRGVTDAQEAYRSETMQRPMLEKSVVSGSLGTEEAAFSDFVEVNETPKVSGDDERKNEDENENGEAEF